MRRIFVSTVIVILVACGRNSGPSGPSTAPTPPVPGASSNPRVFDITFAADAAACSNLPEQARSRTYTTTLSQGLTTLTGARFVETTAPYSAWEALSDESYLVIFGDVTDIAA